MHENSIDQNKNRFPIETLEDRLKAPATRLISSEDRCNVPGVVMRPDGLPLIV
ncbi:hypothetical protein ACFYSC_12015 [Streptosporangium sp. NPDC004379]|uniref:hypothetical protein n=1 Tax=Streptosporangium sp. NPDC004379 TaxID=3366189 RepID=UPI0036A25447